LSEQGHTSLPAVWRFFTLTFKFPIRFEGN
jgi:hypothetical protein